MGRTVPGSLVARVVTVGSVAAIITAAIVVRTRPTAGHEGLRRGSTLLLARSEPRHKILTHGPVGLRLVDELVYDAVVGACWWRRLDHAAGRALHLHVRWRRGWRRSHLIAAPPRFPLERWLHSHGASSVFQVLLKENCKGISASVRECINRNNPRGEQLLPT